MFVELSPELAAERGIDHAGWLTVTTPRGRLEARAMVTRRLRPLLIEGRVIHQIGLPFHWAFAGEVVGGNANDLTALLADPNVSMHEAKAFSCEVRAGRLGDPPLVPTAQAKRWPTSEPIANTPAGAQPEGESEHGNE
jgi:formate dehydrogenase major subunit